VSKYCRLEIWSNVLKTRLTVYLFQLVVCTNDSRGHVVRNSQLTVLSMYYRWLIRVIDGVTCRYEGHAGRLIYTVDNATKCTAC